MVTVLWFCGSVVPWFRRLVLWVVVCFPVPQIRGSVFTAPWFRGPVPQQAYLSMPQAAEARWLARAKNTAAKAKTKPRRRKQHLAIEEDFSTSMSGAESPTELGFLTRNEHGGTSEQGGSIS